jgi:hypothetical protein
MLLVHTFLVLSKDATKQAVFFHFRLSSVTLAALALWDSTHDLLDMLPAAAPGRFAAFAARHFLAHFLSF